MESEKISVNCTFHLDRLATNVCKRYPCFNVGLCEECEALHFINHGENEVQEIEKQQSIVTELINLNTVIAEATSKFLKCLTGLSGEIVLELEKCLTIANRLKIETKELSDELSQTKIAIEDCTDAKFRMIADMRKDAIKLKTRTTLLINDFNGLREKALYLIMTIDTTAIMPCYDLMQGGLVLTNLNLKQQTTKSIPKSEIPSCQTFSLLGGPAVVKVKNEVYMLGGFDKKEVSARVYKVSLKDPECKLVQLASMKIKKYDTGVVQLTGKYVIGENKWTNISHVNVPRSIPGICIFQNRYIYTYSGQSDGNSYTNDLEVYDVLDDEKGWTILRTKPILELAPSSSAMVCQIDGYSMIFFGENKTYKVYPAADGTLFKIEELVPHLEGNFYYTPLMLYKNKLHWTRYHAINIMEEYDLRSKRREVAVNLSQLSVI